MMNPMNMVPCEHALARLWEYLDGELRYEESEAVKKHLEVCGLCFPEYDFQRAYLEYARKLRQEEETSAAFRRALFERILAQDRNGDAR
jgi:anti-sigma factor (TIGR02949 family)